MDITPCMASHCRGDWRQQSGKARPRGNARPAPLAHHLLTELIEPPVLPAAAPETKPTLPVATGDFDPLDHTRDLGTRGTVRSLESPAL